MLFVVNGLLTYTLPSTKHRTLLEANKSPLRTVSRTDDVEDDEEDVVLTEQQEAGVQAAMRHLKTEEFRLALNAIADLPLKIARRGTARHYPSSAQRVCDLLVRRVSVNFRFAPKATELLLCRN